MEEDQKQPAPQEDSSKEPTHEKPQHQEKSAEPSGRIPDEAGADPTETNEPSQELQRINKAVETIKQEVRKVIVGQDTMVDLLIAGLLTGGHVLLEGVPGIAKTLTAKLLAQTLSVKFSRIQFTPDLMPADVVGTNIYSPKTGDFSFKSGPVFSNIVLIDEINRSPAKTQSSLFEVMQERQITVDGETYELDFPFFVIATQNPIEQEGTYKLPEAQLDRFLFRIQLEYPSLEDEKAILRKFRTTSASDTQELLKPVLNANELRICQQMVSNLHIKDELLDYIAGIIHQTREDGSIFLGASPRASLAIMNASKAIAAMRGRDFVTPDDIKFIAPSVLNHRLILTPDKEMEGLDVVTVIKEILERVEIPR